MTKIVGRSAIFCSMAALLVSCGPQEPTSDLKIRGGQEVSDNDLTSVRMSTVALTTDYTKDSGADSILSQGKSFCSGTIIGTRTIITAAHCIQAIEGRDQKGDLILPSASDYIVHFSSEVSADGVYIKAAKVVPHADWDPSQTLSPSPSRPPNDIGLIVLSEDIPDYMQPAAIADADIDVKNADAYLAGYGVTRDRNSNDTGILRTITSKFSGENKNIARVSHGGWLKGICAGDSGGPAYVDVDGELQLVGAASTGVEIPILGCVGSNSNSTDVRFYKDWIAANSSL